MIGKNYLGFTDNMKPMQKTKVENTLDKKIRYNGKVMATKDFVFYLLKEENSTPTVEENYSYYSSKIDGYTKPKNNYELTRIDKESNTRVYNTITKTEYDFANYLIENNLLNEEIFNKFIKDETDRIAKEKQNELDKIEEEKKRKEELELQKNEFDNWLKKQALQYNNNEKFVIAKEIFTNEVGRYDDYQLKKLLVLIDNIETSFCRTNLINWLHSGNPSSKKVFYHVTGIKLPSTNKDTYEILNNINTSDYKTSKEYKKRNKHEKDVQTFYKMITSPEPHFETIEAEAFNKYGLEMFIINYNKQWIISEAKSGLKIASGLTRQEALDALQSSINRSGVKRVEELINQAVDKYGLSPRYQNQTC